MDTRLTAEQAELRRTARRLAGELGPRAVADLADAGRGERLAHAVREAGWLELREDAGGGAPLASGVEAALVAESLAESLADVAFAGPVLAADLARRAGARPVAGAGVAFASDLIGPAVAAGDALAAPAHAVDTGRAGQATAYLLIPDGDGFRLGTVAVPGAETAAQTAADTGAGAGADLTRAVHAVPAGATVRPVADATRPIGRADLEAWTALGLALTSADLVGSMRGVIDVSVAYAKVRKQYGVAIGGFQAVQHLLADALALAEGARSVAAYPAWAVDALAPAEALAAGRVAKAYCARAARTVCETAIQVHGGLGNTWDCLVHVYLRRALLSSRWFGDAGEMLRRLEATRLGGPDGLP